MVVQLFSILLTLLFTLGPTNGATNATTTMPTQAPTIGETYIFIGGDVCVRERCNCYRESYDCDGPNIAKLLSSNANNFTYYMTFDLLPIYFTESSTIASFSIEYIGATENSNNYNSTELVRQHLDTLDSSIDVSSISPLSGDINVTARYSDVSKTHISGNYGSVLLTIKFLNNDNNNNDKYGYSVYKVTIDGCNNAQTCNVVYPSELYIVLENESITGGANGGSNSNNGNNSGELSGGAVAGIVIAVLVVVIVGVMIGVYFYRKNSGLGTGKSGISNDKDNEQLIDKDYNPPQVEVNDKDAELYNKDKETATLY